ncbi:LCP family protein [Nocardia sp. NPDC088792]|uniref:LCP family protein n=1 Tax=Nocardia sp. NPDC088792 TaxID=3364332 RepID=UPI003808CEDE
MGDDRYGRTPRPGGRAPWERFPADEDAQAPAEPPALENSGGPVDRPTVGSAPLYRPVPAMPSGAGGIPRAEIAENAAEQDNTPKTVHSSTFRAAEGGAGVRATGSPADPVTEELPVVSGELPAVTGGQASTPAPIEVAPTVTEAVAAALPATRGKFLLTRRVGSPADYPTTALPSPVGGLPLTKPMLNRRKRNRRIQLAGRSALVVFAVVALLITGGGWSYLRAKDSNFQQVSALDDNSTDVVDADGQNGDENFLLVGTDTRAGVNGSLGAGTTDDAEGARSDTVMLVNIPASRARVVAVSFPRDLDVSRPVCEGWDNEKAAYTGANYPAAIGDKLNATYALGGPKCLTKVITKLSGLKINHFIGIDFAGFESMVNVVGGVEVCSSKPLVDEILGTVLTDPGKQVVDGGTALNYVRARHVYGEERSDYDRINRQQRFLSSLLRGALSNKVLLDPGKLNGFIDAFAQHSFMDNVNTKDLLTLGRSLQKMQAGNITFLTTPTAGTTSYGNEIPRESDIKAIFRAVIDDQPLPGETQTATTATTETPTEQPKPVAVDPSTVSVQVSNGSGQAGVAATTATKLSNQGFQIYSTGNYTDGTSPRTKVRYSSGHEAEAGTVASAVPGAVLEPASGLGSIIEVVAGTDFAGTVQAPTAFGRQLPDTPMDAGGPSAAPVTLPADLEHVNAADDLCK